MRGGRLFFIVAMSIAIAFVLPASALADETVVEAENMTWQANSGEFYGPSLPRKDGSVSGYWLDVTNQTSNGTTTIAKPATGVMLRVRTQQDGTLCQGTTSFGL